MKTYRRASAAYKAAGDNLPILIVTVGGKALYIVGVESMDHVQLVAPARCYGFAKTPSRCISGQVLLGHLDRLGNANHAAAAEYRRTQRVWPEKWGLAEKFINLTDEAACEADNTARKATKD